MKYKIKNHIIDAKSPVEALKIHKLLDSKLKDSYIYTEVGQEYSEIIRSLKSKGFNVIIMGNAPGYGKYIKIEGSKDKLKALQNSGYFEEEIIHDSAKDSMKDSQEELDYLTEEEERAVDDYRQAIANTNNPKLLKLYQHILGEELEHIEELNSAEVVEDSCKTKDYQPPYAIWVKKNGKWKIWGGTHSTSVDKSAFIKEGYEDVKVVKNGEEAKDSCKTKDDRLNISSLLSKAKEFAENDEYQKVANICSNIINSLKQMKEAK